MYTKSKDCYKYILDCVNDKIPFYEKYNFIEKVEMVIILIKEFMRKIP